MAWVRKLPSGRWQGYFRDAHGRVQTVKFPSGRACSSPAKVTQRRPRKSQNPRPGYPTPSSRADRNALPIPP
jgi:hypothetical protein